MTDAQHDRFTRDMAAALAPVVEQEIAKAVRPWRRLMFWSAIGYAVLVAASVVQWWVV